MSIFARIHGNSDPVSLKDELRQYRHFKTTKLARSIQVYTKREISDDAIHTIRLICRIYKDLDHFILLDENVALFPETKLMTEEELVQAEAEMDFLSEDDPAFTIIRMPKHLAVSADNGRVLCVMPTATLPHDEEERLQGYEAIQVLYDELIQTCRQGEVLAFIRSRKS